MLTLHLLWRFVPLSKFSSMCYVFSIVHCCVYCSKSPTSQEGIKDKDLFCSTALRTGGRPELKSVDGMKTTNDRRAVSYRQVEPTDTMTAIDGVTNTEGYWLLKATNCCHCGGCWKLSIGWQISMGRTCWLLSLWWLLQAISLGWNRPTGHGYC